MSMNITLCRKGVKLLFGTACRGITATVSCRRGEKNQDRNLGAQVKKGPLPGIFMQIEDSQFIQNREEVDFMAGEVIGIDGGGAVRMCIWDQVEGAMPGARRTAWVCTLCGTVSGTVHPQSGSTLSGDDLKPVLAWIRAAQHPSPQVRLLPRMAEGITVNPTCYGEATSTYPDPTNDAILNHSLRTV